MIYEILQYAGIATTSSIAGSVLGIGSCLAAASFGGLVLPLVAIGSLMMVIGAHAHVTRSE